MDLFTKKGYSAPMDTQHPVAIEVSASELPESVIARFPERPSATARLVIMVGPDEHEEEYLLLKADIEKGLADLDAGRSSDAEEVFARLEKEFPPV